MDHTCLGQANQKQKLTLTDTQQGFRLAWQESSGQSWTVLGFEWQNSVYVENAIIESIYLQFRSSLSQFWQL